MCVLWDDDDFIAKGDESFMKRVEAKRKYWCEWQALHDKERFFEYLKNKDDIEFEVIDNKEEFWLEYESKLNRKDFNAFGGSNINSKKTRWLNDCVGCCDGKLFYIEGFEDKDYNEMSNETVKRMMDSYRKS